MSLELYGVTNEKLNACVLYQLDFSFLNSVKYTLLRFLIQLFWLFLPNLKFRIMSNFTNKFILCNQWQPETLYKQIFERYIHLASVAICNKCQNHECDKIDCGSLTYTIHKHCFLLI